MFLTNTARENILLSSIWGQWKTCKLKSLAEHRSKIKSPLELEFLSFTHSEFDLIKQT